MGFASGSITFRRFAVVGDQPSAVDQNLLDKLAEFALKEREIGVSEDEEYGWSGGRHVLDGNFSFENNVFGDALLFGLRIDTNKVPADIRKAYQLMEEQAAAQTSTIGSNPSGFISKLQKKDAKDIVRRRVDEDMRSGKFRRSKLVSILWDLPTQTLYCNVAGRSQEMLLEIFERTLGLSLVPITAGSAALRALEKSGRRRDYEDAQPTRFTVATDEDANRPDYPWANRAGESKDFLGNEFALWLWHEAEHGEQTVLFERSLDLDCAFGQTGRTMLRSTGVTRMPEALDALRTGKVPRKAGLTTDFSGQQYFLTLSAESLSFNGLKLPDVEEAENPRVLFEERIGLMRDFCKSLDELFEAFLKVRMSGGWESKVATIRKWIKSTGRPNPIATPA